MGILFVLDLIRWCLFAFHLFSVLSVLFYLQGLGLTMITVSGLIAIYYAVIIAYCVYFFIASMTSQVPWADCSNTWNTCDCKDSSTNYSLADPWNGTRLECRKFIEYKICIWRFCFILFFIFASYIKALLFSIVSVFYSNRPFKLVCFIHFYLASLHFSLFYNILQ